MPLHLDRNLILRMKYIIRSQPRRIKVGGNNYIYVKSIDNDLMTTSMIFLKIFLENYKKTPLIIRFTAKNEPNHPLYSGVKLMNKYAQLEETINIHEPKWVRQFILEGIKLGWTGQNSLDYQDGNEIIENWGFDIFDKVKDWQWQDSSYRVSQFKENI